MIDDSDFPVMRSFAGPGIAVLQSSHDDCTTLRVSCTGAPLPVEILQRGGECRVHVDLSEDVANEGVWVDSICKIEDLTGQMQTHFFNLRFHREGEFNTSYRDFYPARSPRD